MKTLLFVVFSATFIFIALDEAIEGRFDKALYFMYPIIPAALVYVFYSIRR
jgi:hypothetical protein